MTFDEWWDKTFPYWKMTDADLTNERNCAKNAWDAARALPPEGRAMELIREHNLGCIEACGKHTSHKYVRESRRCDSRRDCPDCPMDWAIDLNDDALHVTGPQEGSTKP